MLVPSSNRESLRSFKLKNTSLRMEKKIHDDHAKEKSFSRRHQVTPLKKKGYFKP